MYKIKQKQQSCYRTRQTNFTDIFLMDGLLIEIEQQTNERASVSHGLATGPGPSHSICDCVTLFISPLLMDIRVGGHSLFTNQELEIGL